MLHVFSPDALGGAEMAVGHEVDAPAGWYPDPEQAQTQRYWNGSEWTDQRAPLAAPASAVSDLTARFLGGAVGAVASAIAVFLPRTDTSTSLHIADNSIMATDFIVGGGVIALAIAGAAAAYRSRAESGVEKTLIIIAALIVGAAIYYGTGERLELQTTGPALIGGGETFQGSPGIGVYMLGVGGGLLGLAGLRAGRRKAA
jgi:hypothetical protein